MVLLWLRLHIHVHCITCTGSTVPAHLEVRVKTQSEGPMEIDELRRMVHDLEVASVFVRCKTSSDSCKPMLWLISVCSV